MVFRHTNADKASIIGAKMPTALDRAEAFRAVRYSVTAELAGRRFERFPVDVTLSEHPTALPERLPIPNLLEFADIQPTEMPVIALEQHIAEKVHAYTATYGPQHQPSTRIKDLIDLLLIADLATPPAEGLRESLDATFRNRTRQPLPSALPAPPLAVDAGNARDRQRRCSRDEHARHQADSITATTSEPRALLRTYGERVFGPQALMGRAFRVFAKLAGHSPRLAGTLRLVPATEENSRPREAERCEHGATPVPVAKRAAGERDLEVAAVECAGAADMTRVAAKRRFARDAADFFAE
jgi:hypothetical protein